MTTPAQLWSKGKVGRPGGFVPDAPPAPTIPLMDALQADSFIESQGICGHLNFQTTAYGEEDAVAARVADLGYRHFRTSYSTTAGFKNGVPLLWNTYGIKTSPEMGDAGMGSSIAAARAEMDDMRADMLANYPLDAWGCLLGRNEPDNDKYANGDPIPSNVWVPDTRNIQQALWEKFKTGTTAGIDIAGSAMANDAGYETLGDMEQWLDFGCTNLYSWSEKPSNRIGQRMAVQPYVSGNKPVYVTEGGYHNAENVTTPKTKKWVPEDVSGIYTPRHMFEHYYAGQTLTPGTARFYKYALLDRVDPTKTNTAFNYGLLRVPSTAAETDPDLWEEKPSYGGVKNTFAKLADPGPSFTPAGLRVEVTGGDNKLRYLLFEKRDGTHVLVIWRDESVWNTNTQARVTVATQDITVTLENAAPIVRHVPHPPLNSTTFPTDVNLGTVAQTTIAVGDELNLLTIG